MAIGLHGTYTPESNKSARALPRQSARAAVTVEKNDFMVAI